MKKLSIIIIMFLLMACGEDPGPAIPKYSYTVTNLAGFDIELSCPACETIVIKDGATSVINTDNYFFEYSFEATITTTRRIDIEETGDDKYTITSFEFEVEYRITGTAISVNVTLENETGGTSQFSDVTLPAIYQYRNFNSDFVYVSAQNNGDVGSVKVEILHRDKPFKESTSDGAFVIAMASGSI